jgi:two-component system sensor histidine kinase PilS (NtrC family)
MARQQADLNRLVIDEMAEGALIVDARGRIVAANPAACALLAIRDPDDVSRVDLDQRTEWAGLAALVRRGFVEGHWPADGHELAWHTVRAQARQVRLRARPVAGGQEPGRPVDDRPAAEDAVTRSTALCLLLIEDVRDARQRLQQEKLAAMGRVSAGLAHEIRNPLAAIAQANALLAEGSPRDDQERLVSIVSDNVRRLRQVVDDVLEAVPGGAATTGPVDVSVALPGILDDWRQTVGAGPGVPQYRLPTEPLVVAFDAEHLRRVLVNLLDNAWMHASRQPGSIVVELEAVDAHAVALTVLNDGPAIAAQAHAHLFEPFFSTRSRGTGLGLYLCRELCQRHGARIAYVAEEPWSARKSPGQEPISGGEHGTRFVVTFERLAAEPADAASTRRVRR